MGSDRTERVIVRTTAGFSLLLMCALPLSIIPALWTWDWRWLATGVVCFGLGLAIGVVLRDGTKAATRTPKENRDGI